MIGDELLKAYNDTIDKFEVMPEIPNLNKADADSLEMSAKISIAISLKRIADALEKPEVQVTEYIKPEIFLNKS